MRRPWHLWLVGGASLLWNSGGAYDYLMNKTGNAAYLSMLDEQQLAFMAATPVWFDIGWALGVWGAVLGSLLLLFRSRVAGLAFLISLVGMLLAWGYSLVIAQPSAFEIGGVEGLLFSLVILFVTMLLILYSRTMTRRGYLS